MRARDGGSGDGWWRRQSYGISDEKRTKLEDKYRCQRHPGPQGQRGEQPFLTNLKSDANNTSLDMKQVNESTSQD